MVAAPPEGSLRLTTVAIEEDESFFPATNTFTFSELVYQRGRLVGSDHAVCRFRGRFEHIRCRITLSLPQGTLFLYVPIGPDSRGSFWVTRGTGKYAGKTGTGIYRNISEGSKVVIWLTS